MLLIVVCALGISAYAQTSGTLGPWSATFNVGKPFKSAPFQVTFKIQQGTGSSPNVCSSLSAVVNWTETQSVLIQSDGSYMVTLGAVNPLTAGALPEGQFLCLVASFTNSSPIE